MRSNLYIPDYFIYIKYYAHEIVMMYMAMNIRAKVRKPEGRLGILLVGQGAVSTTVIAGVEAVRHGIAKPFGSLTQMQTIRLGKRSEGRAPQIKDFVPLAGLDDIVFGAWDPIPDDACTAAKKAAVLSDSHIDSVKPQLKRIRPMKAVFYKDYVKNIDGSNVKNARNRFDAAKMLIEDINSFKSRNRCSRLVMINCASTEAFLTESSVHRSIDALEDAMITNDGNISPAMIYAYAAIKCGVPYANGAPSLAADIAALRALAKEMNVPVVGKDFKTGQTLMKTVIAPALKARMLGVNGWFSTNILGNRDGEVLDDPQSFKTKQVSKLSVLDTILQPDMYPELYKDLQHQVHINYYKPRGDNKEGWDNIDIFGWLGYPMQIKVNFLCRDSILAAPIVLDLALLLDLAQRAGMGGVQEWLSFYFKSPMTSVPSEKPEHDLSIQHMMLKNTLRNMMGEPSVDHLE